MRGSKGQPSTFAGALPESRVEKIEFKEKNPPMKSWRNEKGGAAALVFWLAILGICIYLAAKIVPPYISSNEFIDEMDVQAREFAAGNLSEEKVRRDLIIRARYLNLPVKDANIHISRSSGDVVIEVQYTITIDLPIRGPYVWKLSPRVTKPVLN